jgi:A118 family predicted phage portal protein
VAAFGGLKDIMGLSSFDNFLGRTDATTAGAQWPPPAWGRIYDLYYEHDAWYSGDPLRIAFVYSTRIYTPTPRGRFWARKLDEQRRTMLHIPIAGDISSTSANMIFSEHPKIKIAEADCENCPSDATAAQKRLEEIINLANVFNVLLEAAEIASAFGGAYLKVDWDSDMVNYPLLTVAQPDNALPKFVHGILTECIFWKIIAQDDNRCVRLMEKHTKGLIENTLFAGGLSDLGAMVGLIEHEDTAFLPPVIETGLDGLACRYIPNMRPNRRFRASYLGQSDYSGSEGLMDSLDEVYTALIRDVRNGQGRIIAPEHMFDIDDDGEWKFDMDKEVYVGLNSMSTPTGSMGNDITCSQFEIRTAQHLEAANALCRQIFSNAGYSPQTFGLDIQGSAESGTALTIRESKSFKTAAKKAAYWPGAIADLLDMMLKVDRLHLGNPTPDAYHPAVQMQDGIPSDGNQIATCVELLARAGAASKDTLVRMQHTDWTQAQVDAEVARIAEQDNMGTPNPLQVGMD